MTGEFKHVFKQNMESETQFEVIYLINILSVKIIKCIEMFYVVIK